MKTDFKTWTITELNKYRKATKGVDTMSLELPSFQRSVVWSEEKRSELIRSIKREFPIGTFLLHETLVGRNSQGDECRNYLLVDGLQRTQAIAAYMDAQLYYMPAAALPTTLMTAFSAILAVLAPTFSGSNEDLVDLLEQWMRQTKTPTLASGFEPQPFYDYLKDQLSNVYGFAAASLDAPLRMQIGTFLDSLKDECRINDYKIPLLVYSGAAGDLPAIFYNLNKRGMQLTKYEILGAFWHGKLTEISDAEVRKAINDRYTAIEDESGVRIEGIPATGKISDFNLFEYLFGLGKRLAKVYPTLFAKSSDPAEAESIGFTLAALGHSVALADMEQGIPDKMSQHLVPSGAIDPSGFESALRECCRTLDELLGEIYFEVKNHRGMNAVLHTEYQIASMVGILMATRYDYRTWRERTGYQAKWDKLKVTLLQHYLYDIVQDAWRGSGDTRMHQRVWDGARVSDYYLKAIPRVSFKLVLDSWFEAGLGVADTARSPLSKPSKALLRFALWQKITHHIVKSEDLQVDHMLPVARLVPLAGSTGWPINNIGNLSLLHTKLNGLKRAKTLVEYFDGISTEWANLTQRERDRLRTSSNASKRFRVPEEVDKQIRTLLFLPKRTLFSTFTIPQSGGVDDLKLPDYKKALRKNYEAMAKVVLDNLKVR